MKSTPDKQFLSKLINRKYFVTAIQYLNLFYNFKYKDIKDSNFITASFYGDSCRVDMERDTSTGIIKSITVLNYKGKIMFNFKNNIDSSKNIADVIKIIAEAIRK